ncbi:MAG: TatD family hydrolase [Eubacteriales bacterium]|jgi:TatD DNase family protein
MSPALENSERLILADSHAHLVDRKFDQDRKEVIERSKAEGMSLVIDVGYDLDSSRRCAELAGQAEFIYSAVGIHPHDSGEAPKNYLDDLKKLAAREKVVAIGETGLDFYRNLSPQDVQRRVFREQLALARELNLPVIIHSRQAHEDLLKILRSDKVGPAGGVIHCFSGGPEMARECLEMGFYISFAGVITYKGNSALKSIAASVPPDRILAETDSPFLTPEPYRGKRNEPLYVRYAIEEIARLREMPAAELSKTLLENTRRLFGIK